MCSVECDKAEKVREIRQMADQSNLLWGELEQPSYLLLLNGEVSEAQLLF